MFSIFTNVMSRDTHSEPEIFTQKCEQFAKRFQLNWYRTHRNDNNKGTMLGNCYIFHWFWK